MYAANTILKCNLVLACGEVDKSKQIETLKSNPILHLSIKKNGVSGQIQNLLQPEL